MPDISSIFVILEMLSISFFIVKNVTKLNNYRNHPTHASTCTTGVVE